MSSETLCLSLGSAALEGRQLGQVANLCSHLQAFGQEKFNIRGK